MHAEAFQFLTDHAPADAKTVLDVGGRDINGSPRGLFPAADFCALDVADGPGVDVVADIRTWDDKRKFDVVICAEVLEHLEGWRDVVQSCWDRVAAGGVLLITCATTGREPHSAVDGGGVRPLEFYANVTSKQLEDAMGAAGCTYVKSESHRARGDLYASARRAKKRGRKS